MNPFKHKPGKAKIMGSLQLELGQHWAFEKRNGKVKQLISTDTWQLDDYDKYDASSFDLARIQKAREALYRIVK